MSKPLLSIAIVIVNFRTPKAVERCLKSIEMQHRSYAELKVVVVDNNSQDGSYEYLQEVVSRSSAGDWVRIIKADCNSGFGAGNNLGVEALNRWIDNLEVLWFLNPDTEIRQGALDIMLDYLRSSEDLIVGPQILSDNGVVQQSSFWFPSLANELCVGFRWSWLDQKFAQGRSLQADTLKISYPDWLSGASLMLNHKTYAKLGGFDEQFFLYFEETDLCKRASLMGVKCAYVPQAKVQHSAGLSTGFNHSNEVTIPSAWYKSRTYYLVKHLGLINLIAADTMLIIGRAVLVLRVSIKFLGNRKQEDRKMRLRDIVNNSVYNPANWAKLLRLTRRRINHRASKRGAS